MAETQEIVTQENSAVLAELAKSFGETGGESTSTSSLARLRIERENIEDANGDIICPSGYFSVSTDDGKVFAKEVSFRYYEHRYRYKRYDAYAERTNKDGEKVQGAYIQSVLVKGPRDEAPSDDGGEDEEINEMINEALISEMRVRDLNEISKVVIKEDFYAFINAGNNILRTMEQRGMGNGKKYLGYLVKHNIM